MISWRYIFELEQKVLSLQTGVIDIEPSMHDTEYHSPEDFRNLGSKFQNSSGRAVEHGNESDSDTSQSPNYTEGAGIRYRSLYYESWVQKLTLTHSFMSFLFTDPRWREQNQKLLHNLSKRATILETSVQQNSLPSAQEALVVFNS